MSLVQEFGCGKNIVDIVGEAEADVNKSRCYYASKLSVERLFLKEPQMRTGCVEAWEGLKFVEDSREEVGRVVITNTTLLC